ncbi:hypothetical protein BH09VER1_BH09VER1_38600 [soil metagenome]
MKLIPALVAFGFATSLALGDPDLSKLPPPSTKPDITYAADIRPIFEVSCFRCHGEEKQKANLRLDSLEAIPKGTSKGDVIYPNDSAKSTLVISVSRLDPENAMPPSHKGQQAKNALTPEQVGLVRAWIDQGAK